MDVDSEGLTKYERTKLVGMRALQISMGATPLLPVSELERVVEWSPVDIATEEMERGLLVGRTERKGERNEAVPVYINRKKRP